VLDDVSLTHVAFSPEFTRAVEAKQVAQQTALRAAFLVDQAIQEKQGIIVRAKGEATSAELIGDAMRKNKGFLELRRLEAARDIADQLAQSGNKVMLDSDTLLLDGTRYLYLTCALLTILSSDKGGKGAVASREKIMSAVCAYTPSCY
jgi:hypothetical protein